MFMKSKQSTYVTACIALLFNLGLADQPVHCKYFKNGPNNF